MNPGATDRCHQCDLHVAACECVWFRCSDCDGAGECTSCDGWADGINEDCRWCDNSGACSECWGEGWVSYA